MRKIWEKGHKRHDCSKCCFFGEWTVLPLQHLPKRLILQLVPCTALWSSQKSLISLVRFLWHFLLGHLGTQAMGLNGRRKHSGKGTAVDWVAVLELPVDISFDIFYCYWTDVLICLLLLIFSPCYQSKYFPLPQRKRYKYFALTSAKVSTFPMTFMHFAGWIHISFTNAPLTYLNYHPITT